LGGAAFGSPRGASGLFTIYVITDLELCGSRGELLARVGRLLGAFPRGAVGVCCRENRLADAELLRLATSLERLCRRRGAPLLVNRRPDVALLCGAAGVHLGARTVSVEGARSLLPPDALVGYSAHSPDEAWRALARGATFATVSPVFRSPGKGRPIGIAGLRRAVARCGAGAPVFALGGIDAARAPGALAAGAAGVALVRGALAADPGELARAVGGYIAER